MSVDDLVAAACAALSGSRHRLDDVGNVPDAPGLYAVYAAPATWGQLGLDYAGDLPLYIGKAEVSLVTRDLRTHFQMGRTGQSTLRRTLAALLRRQLGLRGIPRNLDKPDRFAHYALSEEHDALLTNWMTENLQLAVWEKPATCADLGKVEVAVMRAWCPPLNLKDNTGSKWRSKVSAARRVMAKEAREWAAQHRTDA